MGIDVAAGDDGDDALDAALTHIDEKAIERNDSTEAMAMLAYYKRLLPFKSLYTWLNRDMPHEVTKNFTHREFALTLLNDVYIRYNSFADWQEWKKEVVRLNPARFEIGPVYTAKPKDRKMLQKSAFKPVSRELVFDIDMTDYDAIRTCCVGKDICRRCWAWIACAVQVLDEALRTDFGFRHLLWVYSGRRGIHLWISDKDACDLGDDARKAIVGWLEVIKGGALQSKKVDACKNFKGLHPALRRALGKSGNGPLSTAFVQIVLGDQDCFRARPGWEALLQLLPSSETEVVSKLRAKWELQPSSSSLEKWSDLDHVVRKAGEKGNDTVWKQALEDIVLQYTYPRIDVEVSKHMNHLLKSPFVIHPATGRVCVPLDAKEIADFDPERDCPTVAQLLRELNAWERKHAGPESSRTRTCADFEKTSLRKHVQLMDRHCAAIYKEVRAAKQGMQTFSTTF